MRLCEGVSGDSAFNPEGAKRRNIELQVGPEGAAVPKGYEVVHVCALPLPPAVATAVAKFPITLDAKGFAFDGRAYSGGDDGILLSDPSRPGEFFALGNASGIAVLLAQRRAIYASPEGNYLIAVDGIGGLTKTGRFVPQSGRLEIDRASDRDAIAQREEFYGSLKKEKRGNVEWELRDSEKAAVVRWEKTAAEFAGKKGFRVRVYPDAAIKALYTDSSRPADVLMDEGVIRVDIDASAPEKPDLITPALATAGLAATNPKLLDRPILAAAAGAQRFGSWWGRDVKTFAAFVRSAGVEPSVEEILRTDPKDVENLSPVLAVGAAASWLDAGARLDGESAVVKALSEPDKTLAGKLSRWREAALRQTLRPPARRPLSEGFLRGVSYAMTNSIEGAYVAPRSLETVRALKELSVNSISVMPYGFVQDRKLKFVHTNPRGETDEGIVRAVLDAHSMGMTVMVKPQLWLDDRGFTGELTMPDDASWRAWFDAYRRFVVHHAVVAEAAGAALFCVGVELKGTEERKNDWKETISAVRLATGAPLTYAANWAAGAADIPFWDALDAIGIDFYDPLAKTEKASDAALEDGVRRAARAAADMSRRLSDKPVIFTEAGYPSVRAAWVAPHDEGANRPPSAEDAARCVSAVYRALSKEPWWRGVYWWKVFSDGRPAAAGERSFNLLGTPAQKAVADGFRQMEAGRP